jgi:hypothetical protein
MRIKWAFGQVEWYRGYNRLKIILEAVFLRELIKSNQAADST